MAQVYAALMTTFAGALIWTGCAFVSGQLLPTVLAPAYEAVPAMWVRIVLLSLPVFGLANWLIAYSFTLSATTAALATIVTSSVAPLLIAFCVNHLKLNIEMMTAGSILIAACVWLHFAMSRG